MMFMKNLDALTWIIKMNDYYKTGDVLETRWERAELLNGRVAMLGVMAALGAYAVTGQLIPGVF